MPVTTVKLTRDMPNRSRVVATLEMRESEDPDNSRALVGGLSPAFSLTGEVYQKHGSWSGAAQQRNGRESDIGGCCHEEIIRAFPGLAFFADMHLSKPGTGNPMHAEANGWYFYAASRGDLRARERYTGFDSVYAWRLAEEGLSDNDAGREEYCYRVACRMLRVDSIPRNLTRADFARFVDDLREQWRYEAGDARDLVLIASKLVSDNPNEPAGDWSIWDLSQATGVDCLTVRRLLPQLPTNSRYVGGVSKHLYTIL